MARRFQGVHTPGSQFTRKPKAVTLKRSTARFGRRKKVLKLRHGGPKGTRSGAIKFFREVGGAGQKNSY